MNVPPARGMSPYPTVPTLFAPMPAEPRKFPDVAGLCAEIHRLRAGRGLRMVRTVAAYGLSSTFPGFNLYAFREDEAPEQWIGMAAVQDLDQAGLEQAIAKANPDQPGAMPATRNRTKRAA